MDLNAPVQVHRGQAILIRFCEVLRGLHSMSNTVVQCCVLASTRLGLPCKTGGLCWKLEMRRMNKGKLSQFDLTATMKGLQIL